MMVIFLQPIRELQHTFVLLFSARISLTGFLRGDSSGKKVSTRWSCVEKTNQLRDS